MTSFALRPAPRRLGRHPHGRRHHRRLAADPRLVSVAGAVDAHVYDANGHLAGLLEDVVVRAEATRYPPVAGLVVRLPRERVYVPIESVADIRQHRVDLARPLAHVSAERRPGFVALAHDVLDRQIVDVNGLDVVRVSDLVLGRGEDGYELVGVDVSLRTLFRRLGPLQLRRRVAPLRVYDWTTVGAFSERGADGGPSVLHLTGTAAQLRGSGRADLDQLLGDLPYHERGTLESGVETG
jgi:hypothetical protein